MVSCFLFYNTLGKIIPIGVKQLELFTDEPKTLISLEDVFAAYYECRKHKRRTMNAMEFEINLEENLIQLWQDLNNETYQVGRSVAFIVKHPVFREVFAANFRDRVVHHLVVRKLWTLINASFSPHSYSCRPGMGTLYGVKKVYEQMQSCSHNFTNNYFVLRLDIQAFFMHIQHNKLYQMLNQLIQNKYHAPDKGIILRLLKKIIFTPVQYNCIIKGEKNDWKTLPISKSLFHIGHRKGLPIGNLTSQIFANFYLNTLDYFIADYHGIFYSRYVDDLVLLHTNKKILLSCKEKIISIFFPTILFSQYCFFNLFFIHINILHSRKIHCFQNRISIPPLDNPYKEFSVYKIPHFYLQK